MRKERVPDLLTAGRLVLVPVLVGLLVLVDRPEPTAPLRLAAVGMLVVLAASDWLDGYLARRMGTVSRRGAFLDAAADKLATLTPLFYWALFRPAAFPRVPLWLPAGLLLLDVVMGALWQWTRRRGPEPPAAHNDAGRITTLIVFLLVGGVTLGIPGDVVLVAGVLALVSRAVAVTQYALSWRRPV